MWHDLNPRAPDRSFVANLVRDASDDNGLPLLQVWVWQYKGSWHGKLSWTHDLGDGMRVGPYPDRQAAQTAILDKARALLQRGIAEIEQLNGIYCAMPVEPIETTW